MVTALLPMNDTGGISVVVASHGRSALLHELLVSLQTAGKSTALPSEVIIVDSSSLDDAARIRDSCAITDAIYVRHEANNVRQKRNIGVEKARYSIILFVDSDCRAMPDLLAEHARGYSDERTGGVIGVTRFVGPDSWEWRVIAKSSFLDAFSYAERLESVPWGPTCNISYRRDVLDKVGTFDTSFPFRLGGDDTDLGLRVTDAGYKIKCNPRAVVEHAKQTWTGTGLIGRRVLRWGRMHFHLMRKYPTRVYLDYPTVPGLFLLLVLLSLVLAAVFRRPSILAWSLIWLASELLLEALFNIRLFGYRLADLPTVLGARLLSLAFQLGTAFEALRHRSLMPFFKEISYTPASLQGRNRRIVQIWACVLAVLGLVVAAALW